MNAAAIGKRAEGLFGTGLYCAESVLLSLAEQAGIDSPLIPRIATGFCGGVSRTKGLCGAVSGGVMALGMLLGRNSPEVPADKVYAKVQEFLRTFESRFGSLNCFDLTGVDLGTDGGRKQFLQRGIRSKCQELTGSAARMAAEILVREGIPEARP